MPSELDRRLASDFLALAGGWSDELRFKNLTDILAGVRREGHAEALAAVRRFGTAVGEPWQRSKAVGEAVDEAERALKSGET